MSEDFYEVLGVSRDADVDEIKRAYREKATEYHPDVSDDPDAEEKFKAIKKAKEVLTDEEKREIYDQLGHERFVQAEKHGGVENGAGAGAGGGGGPGGARGPGTNPFGGMGGAGGMGGLGDIFEEFFGGGSRPRQGDDVVTRVTIDLAEAAEGVEREVSVSRPERCSTCDGAGHPPDADEQPCRECGGQGQVTQVQQTPLGRVQQTRSCPRCEGQGRIYSETCADCGGDGVTRERATLRIDVPAGIEDGQTLRVEGEGAPGERGGPSGDLLVEVRVREHDEFERDGEDLHHRAAVSFPQAVFGDTIEVPTLDGTAEFDLPGGTQSGETFRLEGEGMPSLQGGRRRRRGGRGDLFVHVQVVVPERLNAEQREALEAFAEAGGEEVEVEEGFFERLRNSL